EGRAGLVHQNYFRLYGNGAGDAQALLLAAREGCARIVQSVLDLVPQTGAAERLLDDGVEFGTSLSKAMDPRAVRDVFIDRLRERVGLLEHHAYPGAQLHHVHLRAVDIVAVEFDGSFNTSRRNGVVHPIERPQKRGLAAAGW